MKRPLVMFLLALCLGTAAWLGAGPAEAASVGVGVFGGVSIPVVQDDADKGSVFGARVPISLIPLISVEPYFSSSMLGEAEETFGDFTYTRDGFDVTSFGVNVALGNMVPMPGLRIFPYAGIGKYELSRKGSEDIDETGFDFGLGLGVSVMPRLSLNARGELDLVKTGDTSRKFANVTFGLAYALFSTP